MAESDLGYQITNLADKDICSSTKFNGDITSKRYFHQLFNENKQNIGLIVIFLKSINDFGTNNYLNLVTLTKFTDEESNIETKTHKINVLEKVEKMRYFQFGDNGLDDYVILFQTSRKENFVSGSINQIKFEVQFMDKPRRKSEQLIYDRLFVRFDRDAGILKIYELTYDFNERFKYWYINLNIPITFENVISGFYNCEFDNEESCISPCGRFILTKNNLLHMFVIKVINPDMAPELSNAQTIHLPRELQTNNHIIDTQWFGNFIIVRTTKGCYTINRSELTVELTQEIHQNVSANINNKISKSHLNFKWALPHGLPQPPKQKISLKLTNRDYHERVTDLISYQNTNLTNILLETDTYIVFKIGERTIICFDKLFEFPPEVIQFPASFRNMEILSVSPSKIYTITSIEEIDENIEDEICILPFKYPIHLEKLRKLKNLMPRIPHGLDLNFFRTYIKEKIFSD